MYFAYFDESGDSGYINSPTPAFALAAVLVDDTEWLNTLDQLVSFRRYLKDNFGIPSRAELKAQWLLRGGGSLRTLRLAPALRLRVYEASMRFQRKVGTIHTFAVVINKAKVKKKSIGAREWAWGRAIERLERFGVSQQRNLHILPDEGHGYFIRRLLRRMRRWHYVPAHYSTGLLDRRTENIIEDSSDRESHESYFIQLADLNAYAAFRHVYPRDRIGREMWDELGNARIAEVNRLRGGPTGIVSWP